MRKPDFCICENKDADQLRGNREADQRLRFRYTDSKIPLLSNNNKRGPASYSFCRLKIPKCICKSFIYIHRLLKSKKDIKIKKDAIQAPVM